jgi:hypothetical protein
MNMNYSKISSHFKRFVDNTFPKDFSETPECFLGPNYRSVMNFYALYYSSKLRFIDNKNTVAVVSRFNEPYNQLLREMVLEVIPAVIVGKLPYPLPVWELIAMHLLLEKGEPLKYVSLFTNEDESNS